MKEINWDKSPAVTSWTRCPNGNPKTFKDEFRKMSMGHFLDSVTPKQNNRTKYKNHKLFVSNVCQFPFSTHLLCNGRGATRQKTLDLCIAITYHRRAANEDKRTSQQGASFVHLIQKRLWDVHM